MRLAVQQSRAAAQQGASATRGAGAARPRRSVVRCVVVRSTAATPSSSDGNAIAPSSRRSTVLGGLTAALAVVVTAAPAVAAVDPTALRANKEVDAAESPYIQELLRRSEEKREERKAERLRDYYKRNFRDYMEFDSSGAAARARGISEETAAAMRKWLADNADEPMPGMKQQQAAAAAE